MIELLIFAAGAATGAVALLLPMNRVLNERDMLQVTKDSLAIDVEELKARITTLRGDNLALQNEAKRLGTENVELQREAGRYAAELRQMKQDAARKAQPRDPATGRMLPKPDAKRPRKPRAKPAPISCG